MSETTAIDTILVKAQAGDKQAVEDLANLYGPKLEQICRYYVHNDADASDILQNAWIKIIKNLSGHDTSRDFTAWCKTIIKNEVSNYYKSSAVARNVVFTDLGNEEAELEYDPEDESVRYQPERAFDENERRDMILNILDSLPEDQRIIIMMHYYNDVSLKEIADELELPMSSVTCLSMNSGGGMYSLRRFP